jgi:lon-related putative ATP-dependent protease
MPISPLEPLRPAQLRRGYDPKKVPFETSDQAASCQEPVVGQARAKEALEFGLQMRDMDYHVFVDGPPNTGKTHLVRSFVEKIAQEQAPPPDWVYVHNFRQPDEPRALRFVPGGGREFAGEMAELVEAFKKRIPEIFEGEEHARRKEALQVSFKNRRTEVFSELDRQAREEGYVLKFEPTGIMVAPADEDGQPMPESRIREMDEEERAVLRKKSDSIQTKVTESLRQIAGFEKEMSKAMADLDREMVMQAVGHLFDELFDKYAEQAEVLLHLQQTREHVVDNYSQFQKKEQPTGLPFVMAPEEPDTKKYEVNVFVDNSEKQGAPVVLENHPTFPNLFGRIERQAQFGALSTDFTLLKPGALHKANGGYLVIPVLDLLKLMLPWDGLKRALRDRKVYMEDAVEQLGFMVTRSLRPEPIPLDIKVILVGHSYLYHLLLDYDPQFSKFFKVRAQMAGRMNWEDQEVDSLLSHLCRTAEANKLLPLHRSGAARLVELASEHAGDRERLTLQVAVVEDVLKESDHYARQAGRSNITKEDVETAIKKRIRRVSMMEERLREAITRDFILVENQGQKVGQINGLAVLDMGDHAFGQASRISASLGLGKEGVVDIDRESDLSGPFHTKGVLILSGFLRNRFGQKGPLTLTASLTFEQSYSTIDGDSASLAETLVLLSRIADVPVRQDLAVTGSVSQQGQVQAIGGVNQKIEGFYRLCESRGLTGSQGVVIPQANVKNLMLHPDIVAAAKKKKFFIYAVESVEEALELFTGRPAGKLKKDGTYPQRTVYYQVMQELDRLRELAKEEAPKKKRKTARKKTAAKKK